MKPRDTPSSTYTIKARSRLKLTLQTQRDACELFSMTFFFFTAVPVRKLPHVLIFIHLNMYHSKNKVLDAAGTFLFLLMYILFMCPFVCLFPERYIFPTSIFLNCLNINAKLDVSESLLFYIKQ